MVHDKSKVLLQAQANEGLEPLIEAAQHECTKRHTKRARLQYLKTNVKTYKDHAEHYNECEACGRPFEGTQRETFYRRQVLLSLNDLHPTIPCQRMVA